MYQAVRSAAHHTMETRVQPRPTTNITQRLLADQPSFHGGGTKRWDSLPETLQAIERTVQPGMRTIEIGCGASTVVFTARRCHHHAISPMADEHERVRAYCRSIGVDDGELQFTAGASDVVLPQLCQERVLDAAYVDGAHSFPFPEVDWHYVTRALKVGGTLIMDDVPIPAVAPLFRHMMMEPNWRLEGMCDNRAAVFTLLAAPEPEWWVDQPFNRSYPDYSFVPFTRRTRLVLGHRALRARQRAAVRHPRLRDAWKRLSGHPRTARD